MTRDSLKLRIDKDEQDRQDETGVFCKWATSPKYPMFILSISSFLFHPFYFILSISSFLFHPLEEVCHEAGGLTGRAKEALGGA
jgi:hypothetical protein